MPSAEAETTVSPGEIFAGKYQVTRTLGRGGMGVVVEARHMSLGERVAIKVLHEHYCNHPEAMARFQHEARAAVRIRGEHSARLLDVGTSERGLPFIIMELLEGSDLASILQRGGVSLQEAALYILQACEGMAEVHANGIVHRDLKPGNLFVCRRPDGSPLVKVLDFGIAKSALPEENDAARYQTMTLVALGTPLYMSPEQVRSSRHVDARADIWSLGAILYELVTGRPAFGGNTVANITAQVLEADPPPLASIRPGIPAELERVVRKALAKRPEHRWIDVAAFAEALAPFAGDVGRAHAERAARILRGAGRGPSVPPASDADTAPTATNFLQTDGAITQLSSHRRTRERMLLGMLLGLAVAAAVIGWSVLSAYRESAAAEGTVLTAGKAAGSLRSAVVMAIARAAAEASEKVAPVASESPRPKPTAGNGPSRRGPVRAPAPRPTAQAEEIDPLGSRK